MAREISTINVLHLDLFIKVVDVVIYILIYILLYNDRIMIHVTDL